MAEIEEFTLDNVLNGQVSEASPPSAGNDNQEFYLHDLLNEPPVPRRTPPRSNRMIATPGLLFKDMEPFEFDVIPAPLKRLGGLARSGLIGAENVMTAVGNDFVSRLLDARTEVPADGAIGRGPEDALARSVSGADPNLGIDIPISTVLQLRGIYQAFTGGDLKLSEDNLEELRKAQISPDVADFFGHIVGGISLLMGTSAAIRANKLSHNLGASFYKHPILAEYLPVATSTALTFGTAETYLTMMNQVRDGEMDVAELGYAAMRGGLSGGILGVISAPAAQTLRGALAKVAGSGVFGYGITIADGGSHRDAVVNASIFGALTAFMIPGMNKAAQKGAYMRAKATSMEEAYVAAKSKGHSEEVARGISRLSGIEFDTLVKQNAGVEAIDVRRLNQLTKQWRRNINKLIEDGFAPNSTPPNNPAPIRQITSPEGSPDIFPKFSAPPVYPLQPYVRGATTTPQSSPSNVAVNQPETLTQRQERMKAKIADSLDRTIARAENADDPIYDKLQESLPDLQNARANLGEIKRPQPIETQDKAIKDNPENLEAVPSEQKIESTSPSAVAKNPALDPVLIKGRINQLADEGTLARTRLNVVDREIEILEQYTPESLTVTELDLSKAKLTRRKTPDLKEDDPVAILKTPDNHQIEITHRMVLAEAQSLLERAQVARDAITSDLAILIKENGGIRSFKKSPVTGEKIMKEEMAQIPIFLRGIGLPDGIAGLAHEAGLIDRPNTDDLLQKIKEIPEKGHVPVLHEFYGDALAEVVRNPVDALNAERSFFETKINDVDFGIWDLTGADKVSLTGADKLNFNRTEMNRLISLSERFGQKVAKERIKEQVKNREWNVEGIRKSIIDYANLSLPKKERGAFLATVDKAETFTDLDRAVARMDKIAESSAKKDLLAKIENEISSLKPKRQSGKTVGKFAAQIEPVLQGIRKASKLSTVEAELTIAQNNASVQGIFAPDNILIENAALQKFAGLQEKGSQELAGILAEIKDIKLAGKSLGKIIDGERIDWLESVKKDILAEITANQGIDQGARTFGLKDADSKLNAMDKHGRKIYQDAVMEWEAIGNTLSSRTGTRPDESKIEKFMDVFENTLAESYGKAYHINQVSEIIADAYGIKSADHAIDVMRAGIEPINLGRFKNVNGVESELVFTRNQIMAKIMQMRQPTLTETFFHEKGNAYTPEIVKAMEKALRFEDLAAIDGVLEFYQKYRGGMVGPYERLFKAPPGNIEKYSPIRREDIGTDNVSGFNEFMQEMSVRASVSPSAIKARVPNIKPLSDDDFFLTLQKHISDIEHFKGWAEKIRDLNAVFRDPEIKQAIIENYGKGLYGLIFDFLDSFARNGVSRTNRINWLDNFRQMTTKYALVLRPRVGIGQIMSAPAYATVMPVEDFLLGQAHFWTNPKKHIQILMGSKWVQARGYNFDHYMKEALESKEFGLFMQGGGDILHALMLNVKLGDHAGIMVGGWSLYYMHLKKTGSHEKAMNIFEREAERAQQSSAKARKSKLQRGGSVSETFFMYMTSQLEYMRQLFNAYRNMRNKRISKAEFAKKFFIYHALLPMLFQWMADGFEFRPLRQTRAAIVGPFPALFLFGNFMENAADKMLGGRVYPNDNAIYSINKEIVSTAGFISDALKGDLTTEEFFEEMTKGPLAIASFATGIPAKQAVDMAANFYEQLDEDNYFKAILGGLGWSRFALEDGNTRKKKGEQF